MKMMESTKKRFQIAITKKDFEIKDNESVNAYNKNCKGECVLKCKSLRGNWISCIRKEINDFEQNNYSIIGNFALS